jgi:hypothetical protein
VTCLHLEDGNRKAERCRSASTSYSKLSWPDSHSSTRDRYGYPSCIEYQMWNCTRAHVRIRGVFSLTAGSRVVLGIGPGRASPSCFMPNRFGPGKPNKLLGRIVPARSTKTVAQSGPKPRRAFVGPCRPKPGPNIWPHNIKILQPYEVHNLLN